MREYELELKIAQITFGEKYQAPYIRFAQSGGDDDFGSVKIEIEIILILCLLFRLACVRIRILSQFARRVCVRHSSSVFSCICIAWIKFETISINGN